MIKLIPAIDIIDGHCVRLAQGDYSRKTEYSSQPDEIAASFEHLGYKRLHVVDLDGARQGKPANIATLKAICSRTKMTVDFGGGIKSEDDLKAVFDAGASAVSIGSMAVNNRDVVKAWIKKFGADRFIISADVLNGDVRTHGWKDGSGMTISQLLSEYWPLGVRRVLCTDISRDGMLCGPNLKLYKKIMSEFPDCMLIASGGVSSEDDIDALDAAGIPAVVFGRAIYEGRINLERLAEKYNLKENI